MKKYLNYLLILIIIADLTLFVPVTISFLLGGQWLEVFISLFLVIIPCALAYHFIEFKAFGEIEKAKSFTDIINETAKQPTDKALSFRVVSWGDDFSKITQWQEENARNQWIDGNYSKKALFKYSWTRYDNIKLSPEKTNVHDKYAIKVYLDNHKIGYVPRPLNKEHYRKLLKATSVSADIHGGDFKVIDNYDDLIVKHNDPIVEVTVKM